MGINISYIKKNNDSGLTMVELIIVIAIIAIMVAASVIGVSLLSHGDSKKAVNNLSSQITEVRTNTLTMAGNWTAEIYKKDNSYKLDIKKDLNGTVELVSSTSIGSKLAISYQDSVGAIQPIDNDNKLVISFKQGNGKVEDEGVKLVPVSGGSGTSLIGSGSKRGEIIVNNSSSISNSLTLYYLTGKIIIDN